MFGGNAYGWAAPGQILFVEQIAIVVEETITNIASSSFSLEVDATSEVDSSISVSSIFISDFLTEEEIGEGTGSPTIVETISEMIISIASNDSTLIDLETESPVNTGTGSHFTDGESISEIDTVAFLASQTIDEQRDVVVVPFSDISTGTWTVAPLYEKVDELIVAFGYPTETIRSGSNPSNDTAILQLSAASDPGIDENHFINVEFYKDGTETLDFTVNLKEGSTLIATRTFTDVQETEEAPRRERIALTTNEVDDIVDYSNLNIELIANQTS